MFMALFVIGRLGDAFDNPIAILASVGIAGLVILSFIWVAI